MKKNKGSIEGAFVEVKANEMKSMYIHIYTQGHQREESLSYDSGETIELPGNIRAKSHTGDW